MNKQCLLFLLVLLLLSTYVDASSQTGRGAPIGLLEIAFYRILSHSIAFYRILSHSIAFYRILSSNNQLVNTLLGYVNTYDKKLYLFYEFIFILRMHAVCAQNFEAVFVCTITNTSDLRFTLVEVCAM